MTGDEEIGRAEGAPVEALNLWHRMIVARKHFRYVKKIRKQGMMYATTNHDEVTRVAEEALSIANVLAIPTTLEHGKAGNTTWARCSVTFINPDNPLESYEVVMFGEGNDKTDKGPGKAISYAVKYCYLKGLMVETGEKDADMEDVKSEPSGAEQDPEPAADPFGLDKYGSEADRSDLYEGIKFAIEKYELNPDYVRNKITTNAGGQKPTWDQLSAMEKHVREHPDLWREPGQEKAEAQHG